MKINSFDENSKDIEFFITVAKWWIHALVVRAPEAPFLGRFLEF